MYARPGGDLIALPSTPVLASWNAANHPDQVRLKIYREQTAELLSLNPDANHLAITLSVGLPSSKSLVSGGGDLDNYLYPLVYRLGADRFDAAFASKGHAPNSALRVAAAVPVPWPREPDLTVRTTASAQTTAWKRQVRDACADAIRQPLIDGPVGLEMEFRLSSKRNWSALWKPAIDSLGPALGLSNPARPFVPNDDRIVELGLHRSVDDALGWDVILNAWWCAVRT